MPHLLHRPRQRISRHPVPVPAAAAALTVAALGLTACTSAAPAAPGPSVAGVSTVRLTGAGSTFDAPFFSAAFAAYQQAHPGTAVRYASVGSSAGITRFAAGQVNFGATDVPASTADLAGVRGGPALQVPVDLGAVAVAASSGAGAFPEVSAWPPVFMVSTYWSGSANEMPAVPASLAAAEAALPLLTWTMTTSPRLSASLPIRCRAATLSARAVPDDRRLNSG
jgi:hypothetical protein